MQAMVAICFANRTGLRIGNFTTLVVKRKVLVTPANHGIAQNGSKNGVPSKKLREPSSL
jgi:hypothetical protein